MSVRRRGLSGVFRCQVPRQLGSRLRPKVRMVVPFKGKGQRVGNCIASLSRAYGCSLSGIGRVASVSEGDITVRTELVTLTT